LISKKTLSFCKNLPQREQVAAQKKTKSARKAAKTQRTRKAFLCGTFAALRLCVKIFAFFALN